MIKKSFFIVTTTALAFNLCTIDATSYVKQLKEYFYPVKKSDSQAIQKAATVKLLQQNNPQKTVAIPTTITTIGNTAITTTGGDITQQQQINAIVNAANPQVAFRNMAGITQAIEQAAGDELTDLEAAVKEAKMNRPQLEDGEAIITPSFGTLKDVGYTHIIHTVAPRKNEGSRQDLLAQAYASALQLAIDNNLNSIAFPLLGAGIYGWTEQESMNAAATAIATLKNNLGQLQEIRFVFYKPKDFNTTSNKLKQEFSGVLGK